MVNLGVTRVHTMRRTDQTSLRETHQNMVRIRDEFQNM